MSIFSTIVSSAAFSAIKVNTIGFNQRSNQIITGSKGHDRTVDYITGTKLREDSTILQGAVKSSNYVVCALNTAELKLTEIKEKLCNLKIISTQAAGLSGDALVSANILYKNQVVKILHLLKTAEFNHINLFDGSLADIKSQVTIKDFPKNTAPLKARVGLNIDDNIVVTIPKLLAGRGRYADQSVDSVSTPLFPITTDIAAIVSVVYASPDHLCNWNKVIRITKDVNQSVEPLKKTILNNAIKNTKLAIIEPNIKGEVRKAMLVNYMQDTSLAAEAEIAAAGSLSLDSQKVINKLVENALTVCTGQLTMIRAQLHSLRCAIIGMNISITAKSSASDSYLNVDYEEATRALKNALLNIRVGAWLANQGNLLAEAALKLLTQ